jgi:ankyrin repeat protein
MNLKLIDAINADDIDAVIELLNQGADPAFGKNAPVYQALKNCTDRDIVNLIIDHVNTPNEYGLCPIHIAAISADYHQVANLLALGAEPSIKDNNGKQASDYLDKKVKIQRRIKEKLLEAVHKEDLFDAIHDGDLEEVKSLIANFPGMNDPADIFGRTLLTTALNTEHFSIAMFQYLLEQGALINSKVLEQVQDFDVATQHELNALIHNNINLKNAHGLTPLHRAIIRDIEDSVFAYIDLGADTKAEDNNGNTPFYYARGAVAEIYGIDHSQEVDELLDELSSNNSDETSTEEKIKSHTNREEIHANCDQLLMEIHADIEKSKEGSVKDQQAALIAGSEKVLQAADKIANDSEQSSNGGVIIAALVGIGMCLLGAALLLSPLGPFAAATLVTHSSLTASAAVTTATVAAYTSVAVGSVMEIAAACLFFSQSNNNEASNLADEAQPQPQPQKV